MAAGRVGWRGFRIVMLVMAGLVDTVMPAGGLPVAAATGEAPVPVVFSERSETPRRLYRVGGNGSRTALSGEVDAIQPAWSPDGDRVAFASESGVSAASGLYVVAAEGGSLRRLVEGRALYPAWSPDGLRIAFSGEGGHLWLVRADGTGLRRLTDAQPSGFVADFSPSWSPDGSQVTFVRAVEDGHGGGTEIRVVSPVGSGERRIADGHTPSWSPDGRWIAFAGDGIELVRPDGTGRHRVAAGSFGAAWSPDGRHLAVPDGRSLAVVDAASGRARTVVPDAGAEVIEPGWSGDGGWITYSAAGAWRVAAAGGAPQRLSATAAGRDPVPWPGRTRRAGGPTRVETAIAASQQAHDAASTVILASAGAYPDALAGAALAGALGAPVLLNPPEGLHPAVRAELDRLSADRVILLGGEAALGRDVAENLRGRDLQVERIAGASRFDTAALIAQRVGDADTAFLVEGAHTDPGRGWPDAVAVSGLAAAWQQPVLLTLHGRLPTATRQAIHDLGIRRVVVVGGSAAVSEDVVAQVQAAGVAVQRIHGPTRYETSLRLAQHATDRGLAADAVWLATGRNWPDSLAAGPAAAAQGALLLLVDGRSPETTPEPFAWMDLQRPATTTLTGGADVLSAGAAKRANQRQP